MEFWFHPVPEGFEILYCQKKTAQIILECRAIWSPWKESAVRVEQEDTRVKAA